jgi:hypothetical protein
MTVREIVDVVFKFVSASSRLRVAGGGCAKAETPGG